MSRVVFAPGKVVGLDLNSPVFRKVAFTRKGDGK